MSQHADVVFQTSKRHNLCYTLAPVWTFVVPKNRQRHPGAARRGGVSFARKLVAMKPFLADTLKRTARALVSGVQIHG